jgi:hypothetical protein
MDASIILGAIGLCGGIVGTYVALNNRVTVVETKLDNKVDRAELFEKLDGIKEALEKKIEKEIHKCDCYKSEE